MEVTWRFAAWRAPVSRACTPRPRPPLRVRRPARSRTHVHLHARTRRLCCGGSADTHAPARHCVTCPCMGRATRKLTDRVVCTGAERGRGRTSSASALRVAAHGRASPRCLQGGRIWGPRCAAAEWAPIARAGGRGGRVGHTVTSTQHRVRRRGVRRAQETAHQSPGRGPDHPRRGGAAAQGSGGPATEPPACDARQRRRERRRAPATRRSRRVRPQPIYAEEGAAAQAAKRSRSPCGAAGELLRQLGPRPAPRQVLFHRNNTGQHDTPSRVASIHGRGDQGRGGCAPAVGRPGGAGG